jgi:hypothetical protein
LERAIQEILRGYLDINATSLVGESRNAKAVKQEGFTAFAEFIEIIVY